ncbi:nuclear transport factor 2 family protein [Sphingomonas sp.]|uniref:nuclear transport factor 2 family protein n=1 Tax=Sphingomonas sp. TaxID=28214 RepID=UPI003B3B588B
MTSEDHLTQFLEAMHEGDVVRASEHLSETVELNSPILPTPFTGRASVSAVLGALLSTIDAFEPKMMMREGADVIAVLAIRFEDHVIDAFDHVRLGEDGRIETMTIAWRPLPAVVAVQQRLVPKLGGKAMRLVPVE